VPSVVWMLALLACEGGSFNVNGVDVDNDGYTVEFDCDDRNSAANPDAPEVCDNADNDCNGTIDDNMELFTFHPDVDGDGYGDMDPQYDKTGCNQISGWVINGEDCDDLDDNVHPSAKDVCDDVDNDCSGVPDDDPENSPVWYVDADGDGDGTGTGTVHTCDPQEGLSTNDDDCDDTNDKIGPSSDDVCNGLDDDCDGNADNDIDFKPKWFDDDDQDGYGDKKGYAVNCEQPNGYTDNDLDCDDTRATSNPDAEDLCNSLDDDCNGTVDDDPDNFLQWYVDLDKDGYGTTLTGTVSCKAPNSTSASKNADCDDTVASVHPNAPEKCNQLDDDCDEAVDEDATGAKTWYVDADLDGHGVTAGSVTQCQDPGGRVLQAGDCDDADKTVYPGAPETCDDVDDDCDTKIDDNAIDWPTWYNDGDADGFGNPATPTKNCDHPTDTVSNKGDCDDTDKDVFPRAGDTYGDQVDGDCDGRDCEAASDGSTYFAFCADDLDAYDADAWCATKAYDGLAAPLDAAEQAFLLTLVTDAGKLATEAPWLGLTDEAVEGTWAYRDDTAATYLPWSASRPDGDENDNCAQLNWPLGGGTWNDLSCYSTRTSQSYVCEGRAPEAPE
jgi:hypothetical protein